MVLERELVSMENILRNSLANVSKVKSSSHYIYIRNYITSLKTKTKNNKVANHALVTRKKQTGHVHAAE